MERVIRLTVAAAALGAATVFHIPASFAYGDAPWCAVTNRGNGDMSWDCSYRSAAECQPNVIAGNRGFCNLNPWPATALRAPYAPPRHRKHQAHR
jgi:hypothetical protein